jgi:hypothetical protein
LFLSPVEEQAVQPKPTVGFKPSETKAFRPATPDEAAFYGGGFGQIDTSTGQFYPITQSSNEKGSFRPATEQESVAYGGTPGQIDTKTGRFYALPREPRLNSFQQKMQALEEARTAYASGDNQRALNLLNSAGIQGLFGNAFTAEDLPQFFVDNPVAPPAQQQGERPPLDSIIPNVRPR